MALHNDFVAAPKVLVSNPARIGLGPRDVWLILRMVDCAQSDIRPDRGQFERRLFWTQLNHHDGDRPRCGGSLQSIRRWCNQLKGKRVIRISRPKVSGPLSVQANRKNADRNRANSFDLTPLMSRLRKFPLTEEAEKSLHPKARYLFWPSDIAKSFVQAPRVLVRHHLDFETTGGHLDQFPCRLVWLLLWMQARPLEEQEQDFVRVIDLQELANSAGCSTKTAYRWLQQLEGRDKGNRVNRRLGFGATLKEVVAIGRHANGFASGGRLIQVDYRELVRRLVKLKNTKRRNKGKKVAL